VSTVPKMVADPFFLRFKSIALECPPHVHVVDIPQVPLWKVAPIDDK
jgi:hypothetical protein